MAVGFTGNDIDSILQYLLERVGNASSGGTTISQEGSTAPVSLTYDNIVTALGFTPYSNANPDGYITLTQALEKFLTNEEAQSSYLSKEEAARLYLTLTQARQYFLSKTEDDTADGLIRFLQGLKVGNTEYGIGREGASELLSLLLDGKLETTGFRKSMTQGSEWGVDKSGNMQVESIEVRSYMKVLELIYNRLSAQGGDFVFTESGTVETCTDEGNGDYTLKIRKDYENDVVEFSEGDVLRGIVNDLVNKGVYYTSWLRVISVDTSENEIRVRVWGETQVGSTVMDARSTEGDYALEWNTYTEDGSEKVGWKYRSEDGQGHKGKPCDDYYYHAPATTIDGQGKEVTNENGVPSGKNFKPTELMVLHRWGNTNNPERQSCWYISSYEKRIVMLDGVRQPILEESNYSAFFGLPYNMSNFKGYSMNSEQPYLYARGAFLQDVNYISYLGYVRNPDREFRMDIDTGGDTLLGTGETKTITCIVRDGYNAVVPSEYITASSVTRDSGNTEQDRIEDNAWNTEHRDFTFREDSEGISKAELSISLDDLAGKEKVTFVFTAIINKSEKVTNTLNIL